MKFVAITYLQLDEIDFDEYRCFFPSSGYSSVGTDSEKTKKYLDEHHYQRKSVEDCIEVSFNRNLFHRENQELECKE
jgi:hypothetical protein